MLLFPLALAAACLLVAMILSATFGWSLAPTWIALTAIGLASSVPLLPYLRDPEKRRRPRLGGYSLQQLDGLSGAEFEDWVALIVKRGGFRIERTPRTRDYGVDIVAEGRGVRIGIEVKRRDAVVGSGAVRSLVAGCQYHRCHAAAIVTQSRFSRDAGNQAAAAEMPVTLVARDDLGRLSQLLWALCP